MHEKKKILPYVVLKRNEERGISVAWEQKTFVFPEPWGLTPLKCKGSCLLRGPHHGSTHKVQGMSILEHFLLLLSPSLLGYRPSPSLQRPLRASAAALGAPGRGMWRAAHHLPQEVPAIRASVSHYRTTAKHSEAHSQQPAPLRVPWKLF